MFKNCYVVGGGGGLAFGGGGGVFWGGFFQVGKGMSEFLAGGGNSPVEKTVVCKSLHFLPILSKN